MSKLVSEEEKHIVFSVTMPRNVVKKIDRTRGFMPRSTWLKALALNELKRLHDLHERKESLLPGLGATNYTSQATNVTTAGGLVTNNDM
jgi:hypothetical protein